MSLAEQSLQWYPTSVQVTVLQARGLRIKGKNGTNDAYAIMLVAKEKFSTSVAEKCVAPVWKEEATFDLPLFHTSNVERCTLQVCVMHRALMGPDKTLGQATINLLELHDNKSRNKTGWFKLVGKTGKADKDRGEVYLDIQFMKNNMTASMFDLSGQDKSRSKLGKLKDKLKGKKKDGMSDSASAIVPSVSHILTDSEGEEETNATSGAKKKNKLKSLFAPKSGLHRNMSQSMSTLATLPEKDSAISLSRSSGLNIESPEGKKKFKFLKHKHTASSDSKVSQSASSLGQGVVQTNVCINGSHVYTEEPETRGSRAGSTFSLNSSGHGSMEDLRRGHSRKTSNTSVDSLNASELQTQENAAEEMRGKQEEQKKQEKEVRKRLEEEKNEQLRREEMRKEEERKRIEEEMVKIKKKQERVGEEEERKQTYDARTRADARMSEVEKRKKMEEEEKARLEEEKWRRVEEEERARLEKKRLRKEEETRRIEMERRHAEEEERLGKEKKEAEEMRKRKEEEERKMAEEEVKRKLKEKEAEQDRIRQEKEEKEKQKKVKEQPHTIEKQPEVKPRSARLNTVKKAEKPEVNSSEYVPSANPFEETFSFNEISTNTFEQHTIPQPEAHGRSAKVYAVKPRSHAVKPLSTTERPPDLRETQDNSRSTISIDGMQAKMKAIEAKGTEPYSQLTHEELVSLLEKQKEQLSQKDSKIVELEQYIDNLLVRVIEEKPSILMSLSSLKKSV
ncbi:rab11 family-interacting protein 1-like [Myxocyprinus asiaticus]|uniref:rab11 family-interacting protein 1-like n=1 Tax=Myxocyprinus asiaticus TaxID=70543 RepID=UPI00222340FD|nr:rab11 family-interacting protein 1-like [Myxocyprinus asiaticus]